jgi:hypothetical protein
MTESMIQTTPPVAAAVKVNSDVLDNPRLILWLYGLLLLGFLVPLFFYEWPIGVDYLTHLPRLYILRHLDSDPYLHQFFQANPAMFSNLGFDVLAGLFYRIVDLTTAGNITIGISILAYGISCAWLFYAAHRRISLWMLTSLIFLVQFNLVVGMVSHYLAQSLFFAFLGYLLWRGRYSFGWRENLGLAAFSAITFVCHAFPWLYCLVAWGFWQLYGLGNRHYRLFSRDGINAVVSSLCLLLPGLIIGLWFRGAGYAEQSFAMGFDTINQKITKFSNSFGAIRILGEYYVDFYVVGCFFALTAIIILNNRIRKNNFLVGLALIFLGLATLFPDNMFDSGVFDARLYQVVLTLAVISINPIIADKIFARFCLVFLTLCVGIRIATFAYNADKISFDVNLYRAAFQQLDPGKKLLLSMQIQQNNLCYLYGNPYGDLECKADSLQSTGVTHVAHYTSFAIMDRSVFATPFFAHPAKHSVIVRPAYQAIAEIDSIPVYWEWLNGTAPKGYVMQSSRLPCFRQPNCPWPTWRQDFDYIMIMNLRSDFVDPPGMTLLFTDPRGYAKLYAIDHSWQAPNSATQP